MKFANVDAALYWFEHHADCCKRIHIRRDGAIWVGELDRAPGKMTDWQETSLPELEVFAAACERDPR